jgi:hypothetical protein
MLLSFLGEMYSLVANSGATKIRENFLQTILPEFRKHRKTAVQNYRFSQKNCRAKKTGWNIYVALIIQESGTIYPRLHFCAEECGGSGFIRNIPIR